MGSPDDLSVVNILKYFEHSFFKILWTFISFLESVEPRVPQFTIESQWKVTCCIVFVKFQKSLNHHDSLFKIGFRIAYNADIQHFKDLARSTFKLVLLVDKCTITNISKILQDLHLNLYYLWTNVLSPMKLQC